MKKRNQGLDILKCVCSFLVICIHAKLPGTLGVVVTPLTRIAVPLFFMITGYFYSETCKREGEKRQIRKITGLFVASHMLYFAYRWAISYISGQSLQQFLVGYAKRDELLKFLFLNNSPVAEHLWYLSAILYVLVIILFFEKKWDRSKLYPLIPLLLLGDLVLGKYSIVLWKRSFPYILVRNFAFVGVPYFLIGDILYRNQRQMKRKSLLLLSALFVMTTLLERFILGALDANAARDHYLSTTGLAITLFLLALQYEGADDSKLQKCMAYSGAKLSLGIYVIHPMLLWEMNRVVKILGIATNIYRYMRPFIVFGLSNIIVWGYLRIKTYIFQQKKN